MANEEKKLALLTAAQNITTIDYESKPDLLQGKLSETPLVGREIKKIQKVQVNPLHRWRKVRAKAEGKKPSEIEVAPLPDGYEHHAPGITTDGKNYYFQASPVHELGSVFTVDGRVATEEEVDIIISCLRKRDSRKPQMKTYRLDRIRRVTCNKQTITG